MDSMSVTLERLSTTMAREFADWEEQLPRPQSGLPPRMSSPDEGGMPAGWRTVSCLPEYLADTDLWLARRDGGGWTIVRHERDIERGRVFWVDETLGDLYDHVVEAASNGDRFPLRLPEIADWLKGVLVGMYDVTDPTEAAEQVLFALSGTLTLVPAPAR